MDRRILSCLSTLALILALAEVSSLPAPQLHLSHLKYECRTPEGVHIYSIVPGSQLTCNPTSNSTTNSDNSTVTGDSDGLNESQSNPTAEIRQNYSRESINYTSTIDAKNAETAVEANPEDGDAEDVDHESSSGNESTGNPGVPRPDDSQVNSQPEDPISHSSSDCSTNAGTICLCPICNCTVNNTNCTNNPGATGGSCGNSGDMVTCSGNGRGGNNLVSCLNMIGAGPTSPCMVSNGGNGNGGNNITSNVNYLKGGSMLCCSGNGAGPNNIRSVINIITGDCGLISSNDVTLLQSLCNLFINPNCSLYGCSSLCARSSDASITNCGGNPTSPGSDDDDDDSDQDDNDNDDDDDDHDDDNDDEDEGDDVDEEDDDEGDNGDEDENSSGSNENIGDPNLCISNYTQSSFLNSTCEQQGIQLIPVLGELSSSP